MVYQLIKNIQIREISDYLKLAYVGKDISIQSVASLYREEQGSITFSKKPLDKINPGSGYIVSDIENMVEGNYIVSQNPRLDFAKVLSFLNDTVGFKIIREQSIIHHTAKISPFAVIGKGVQIGENSAIGHFSVIGDCVKIGKNCKIQSGAIIGEDGFGYERDENGVPIRLTHLGSVEIGDDVEIGNNTTIDRGTLGNTIIGNNVKIDNLVHIAHNIIIEGNAMIIACAEISGGVRVKAGSWIGPNASIIQKVEIGQNSFIGIAANVIKDVPDCDIVVGNPAKSIKK